MCQRFTTTGYFREGYVDGLLKDFGNIYQVLIQEEQTAKQEERTPNFIDALRSIKLPDGVPLNEATIYGRHRKQLMELTSNQDISNNLESLKLYRTKCQSEAQNDTPAFKKLWAALDNPDTVTLKIPSLLRKLF